MKHTVYLSLGSNVGDRIEFLAAAIRGITDFSKTVVDDISSVYLTEPVGGVPQPDFLNVCISVRTDLACHDFHLLMKALEKKIGRTETVRWGPREIDIDLLFFDHTVVHSELLTIPHKEIVNRKFVLQPLSDIAPMFVHPEVNKTIIELLHHANDTHGIKRSELHTSQLLLMINDSIAAPSI
jgi:dihydroneopterin aldolase/2-amino-4-hydroxy-6-hydroxymethyldihydropteridine diphosphokinase